MTRSNVVGLVALLLSTLAAPYAQAGTTGVLRGRVTEFSTGRPIADAYVRAASIVGTLETTTGKNGYYVFISTAPSTYAVSVEHTGYNPRALTGIIVAADATADMSTRMTPACTCMGRASGFGVALAMMHLNTSMTILNRTSAPDNGIRSTAWSMTFVPGVIP